MNLPRAGMVTAVVFAGLLASLACVDRARDRDEQAWHLAEKAHREGVDGRAFHLWTGLDKGQPRGREAHERLRLADERYRLAIDLFRDGKPGVREAVQLGITLGPMDPGHYLTFARLCARHGVTLRAVDFYRKYLGQDPPPSDTALVRKELLALDGGVDPFPETFVSDPKEASIRVPVVFVGMGGLVFALGLAGYRWRRNRRRHLSVLLPEHPEWHPTVAYHLGCLRHEFLKHRVGPLGEPLRAVLEGRASDGEERFLRERLAMGLDLSRAWRSQLSPLERTLGLACRVDRGDPVFAGACGAIRVLDSITWPLQCAMAKKLLKAHSVLMGVDTRISCLIGTLVRCRVDEAFMWDVVTMTRAEWAMGKVELHDLRVGPVPEGVEVEVFRTDLFIVLRNLVRNAITSMQAMPGPRRLALAVAVEMIPTGEELVVIRVLDSNPKEFPVEDTGTVERGLGIVAAVLRRYDGSMRIEPGQDGYAKVVAVRFFRSQWSMDTEAIA